MRAVSNNNRGSEMIGGAATAGGMGGGGGGGGGSGMYRWGDEATGVFTFGQNSYGELGHGDVIERQVPMRMELLGADEVVDVACGNEQTTLLCADGQVYTCGYNDSGQCGTGSMDRVLNPLPVPALADKKIVRVFAGNGCEHVAAISDSGELYTFGFNSRGQLGHGSAVPTRVPVPTRAVALQGKRVVTGAASYFHTVVVTEDGDLLACGRNDVGQLGTGDVFGDSLFGRHEDEDEDTYGRNHQGRSSSSEGMDRPTLTRVAALSGLRVMAVACGQHHTVVAVGDGGGLYAFGKNDHGQLGLGAPSPPVVQPIHVAGPLAGATVASLSCGYYHTAVVTDEGAVYTFGRNDYGQLGLGHKRHMATPSLVDMLARMRIIEVACGCYHTLTLSEDGKVYPFGRNNHGQLGLETSLDCLTPQIIPSLRNSFVKKLAAGFYHSVCVTGDDGRNRSERGTLSSDLRRMLNNPERSDVTFLVEGQPLHAHICFLMARCEPLEKMLDGRTKDESLPQILIPNTSYDAFAALLEYLYTDEVAILESPTADADLLFELMMLADQYLVTILQRRCEAAILRVINIENVCALLHAAQMHDVFKLRRRCIAFILDRFSDVIVTESFVSLPPPLLQEVLAAAARNGVAIPNQKQCGHD